MDSIDDIVKVCAINGNGNGNKHLEHLLAGSVGENVANAKESRSKVTLL